jgi:predicted RNA binding protein YcfA (HicA-like mRNA interferase family)
MNDLFDRFRDGVDARSPGLIQKTVLATTKNNGYHLWYRCDDVGRNTVLACRPTTDIERFFCPEELVKVLIETRANGGYGVVAPTPGYVFVQGDLGNAPWIQPEEREILFSVARSFNTFTEPGYEPITRPQPYSRAGSPLLDFDRRGDVVSLLEKHGWIVVRQNSIQTLFRRPGPTDHDTSGDYHHQLNMFGVMSTSTVFKKGKGYRPSAVFAHLECGGDFTLAAKRLVEAGYGIPYRKQLL